MPEIHVVNASYIARLSCLHKSYHFLSTKKPTTNNKTGPCCSLRVIHCIRKKLMVCVAEQNQKGFKKNQKGLWVMLA